MKGILTFLITLMTFGVISAQTPDPVILRMEVEQVPGSNQQVISKLLVSNFKNITGYQFSIRWFPGEMFFLDYERFGPAELNLSRGYFGTNDALLGSIRTVWNHPLNSGVTLDDDTELFALRFKKIWGDGRFSITGNPLKIEFIDPNLNTPDVIFIDNFGDVSYFRNGILSSTQNLESEKITLFPNPAKERIFFKWDHMKQIPDQAFIYNLNGQLISQRAIANQSIDLPDSIVAGTYVIMLQKAGETVAVKKIQVQK